MEVGGLGFFNTIAAGKQQVSDKPGNSGGFAGMMAGLIMGNSNVSGTATEQVINPDENLNDLIAFLKTADLLDLEKGGELFGSLISDSGDLLEKALEHFGIKEDELNLLIQKWSALSETDAEEMPEEELIASLAALLGGIANLPQKDLAIKLEKSEIQAIKALKLYELMAKYADGYEQKNSHPLKESLQNLGEKLENLVKQSAGSHPTEYLQNRFTRLAGELNLSNSKNPFFSEANVSGDVGSGIKAEGQTGTIAFLPQMAKAEQLTLMMNSPEKPVSAEQLMKQFESILSKSQFINSGGTQKLFIKLFPEHLGSIRIELFQKDQTMMARIITSSGTAKDTLESQINGLKQAFAAQNISVERIEISQQTTQQERFLNRDSQQQHRQPDRQEQEKKEEKAEFNLSFEEALLNTEV
jgi:flagellar hook-length control protein FliK